MYSIDISPRKKEKASEMPPLDKSTARSSTIAAKGKTPEVASKTTSDRDSHASDPKKPATKSSIPPKRPLTTPRGPSFASDRSRSKPSTAPLTASTSSPRVANRVPGSSRATGSTSTSTRRTSFPNSKPPVSGTQSKTRPLGTDLRQQIDKESVTSPTTTEYSQVHENDVDEVDGKEGTKDRGAIERAAEVHDEKEDDLTRLMEELEYLKSSLTEKTEEAKRESNARVIDLESELEDAQTKLRQIEAAAETAKQELDFKNEAFDELQSKYQDLEENFQSINDEKDRVLRDADRRHAQQLKEAASKLDQQANAVEQDLRKTITSLRQKLQEVEKRYEKHSKSSGEEKQLELDELHAKYRQELDAIRAEREAELKKEVEKERTESEARIQNARKELEQARKVARDAETTRTELQREVEETRRRADEEKNSKGDLVKELDALEVLRQELEDQQSKLKQEHEGALEKTKKELAEVWKRLEDEKQDSTGYERELAELRIHHDRKLQDKSSELETLQEKISTLEEIERTARTEQERSVGEMEAKGKAELVEAKKHIKRLEEASLEHEQHFRNTVQKHRKDLEERDNDHEREQKELRDNQKDLEYSLQQSKRELSDSLKHQNEAHVTSEQRKRELDAMLERQQQLEKSLEHTKTSLEESLHREKQLRGDIEVQDKSLEEARRTETILQEANENQRQLQRRLAEQVKFQEAAEQSKNRLEESLQRQRDLELQISAQGKDREREAGEFLEKHKNLENAAEQYKKELEEAANFKHTLQDKIAELSQNLERSRNAHEEITKELGSSKDVILNIRNENDKKLAELASDRESAIKRLKIDHKQEIERFRDRATELESLNRSLNESNDKDVRTIEEVNASHQRELEDLKQKHRLQQQAAAKTVVEIREALQKANSAREAAEQARYDLEKQSLPKSIQTDEEFETLKEAHKSALKEVATLQASLNSSASDRKEGVEMIRTQKKRIEGLEQAKAIAEKQLQESSQAEHPGYKSLQQDYDIVLQEINSMKESLANATKDRKAGLDVIQGFKEELDAAEQNRLRLENKLQEASREQEQSLANLKKEQEESSQRQVVALQSSIDRAALERKEGVEAIRTLKKQITELNKMRDAAHAQVSDLEARIQGETAPRQNVELESLRADYQAALEKINALQVSVDTAANERKEGVETIRMLKKQIAELSKDRDAAQEHLSQLQHALESSEPYDIREPTRANSLIAKFRQIKQERDATCEQLSKLQACSRLVDAESTKLATQTASQQSTLEEAHRKHTLLLEEHAKAKAISSRKEHEVQQRLRHLDTAHSEALANATSLAQQLHDAKARLGRVDELERQLNETRQEIEKVPKTDAIELRRHVSALGRHFTSDMADVEALKVDLEREMEGKEEWFRRDARARKGLAEALDATRAGWTRPVSVGEAK